MIYPWYIAIFDASIARGYLDRLWQTAMAGDSLPPGDESWRHWYTPHIQHDTDDTQQIGEDSFPIGSIGSTVFGCHDGPC